MQRVVDKHSVLLILLLVFGLAVFANWLSFSASTGQAFYYSDSPAVVDGMASAEPDQGYSINMQFWAFTLFVTTLGIFGLREYERVTI